jgi:PspAA-like protein
MIVRILGEGQLEVPDSALDGLNELDEALIRAVEAGDEAAFRRDLDALLDRVRATGQPVADDYLGPSDLMIPAGDSTLEEVRSLLGDEGLIPG